ncbi:hypothetical protein SXCC_03097 [Gluconacetobacter sp. SXCC-1]|nr:hypothetical protein SXCC_03097 [Gluconacetobacter sp. SXCC-1]
MPRPHMPAPRRGTVRPPQVTTGIFARPAANLRHAASLPA